MRHYETIGGRKIDVKVIGKKIGPTYSTDDPEEQRLIESSWPFKRRWIMICDADEAERRAAEPVPDRLDPLKKTSFSLAELKELSMPELRKIAKDIGFKSHRLSKKALVVSIIRGVRVESKDES